MEEDYIGVIAEPWDLERYIPGYSDVAMDRLRGLDKKCLLVDDPSKYGEGEFDLISYDEINDYVDDDAVFVTGEPTSISDAVTIVDQDPTIDQTIFSKVHIQKPRNSRLFWEEIASLIPIYEPDRQHVTIKSSEEILEALGLEESEKIPLHDLNP